MADLKKIKLPAKTKIVAVSKLQSVEKIKSLYNQGQKIFAENYVQEALPKIEELKNLEIEWHFIGTLQTNKAKMVVGNFDLIHSVDSLKLARQISKIAMEKNLRQKILLQVNLANEESKSGFSEKELLEVVTEISKLPGVHCIGLMTMPPLFDNPEDARPYFQRLKQLLIELAESFPDLAELSMGTSSDYQVAAQEGATLVRLGTILFGERPQK